MSFYALRFNLYLLLAAVVVLTGCKTKKSDPKNMASLRFYIESRAQTASSGEVVTLLRASPVTVTVNHEPILTEKEIIAAALLETLGGYAIEVKFDSTGTYILEQYTAANPGKHFVLFSQWTDKANDSRWIAAPLISKRVADGIYAFTPDASREESKLIVSGLNNMAKKVADGKMKL